MRAGAERFSASAQSVGGFNRLPWPSSDPTLPRMPEGVIMTSQAPSIRGMSVSQALSPSKP